MFGLKPLLGLEPMAPIRPQLLVSHANHSATETSMCMYVCMYVCMYICIYIYIYIYIYMCVCVCVCVCVNPMYSMLLIPSTIVVFRSQFCFTGKPFNFIPKMFSVMQHAALSTPVTSSPWILNHGLWFQTPVSEMSYA